MSPEALLDEVKLMVGKLKMEARALPAHTASQKLQEVRGYEAHVRQLEAQVRSGLRAGDRAELLGQRADGALPGSASQRDRLLQSTQKLDKSGERIQQSRQMVADMEAQGAAILQNLHGQRETIQRSQQKLHEADQNISSSQKILRRMGRWLPF
ncbi:g8616 [Coccomyxa viridis]|uniref:G8616 protein n=1 Tax=Coccomyxa viridis TaxID=1274662 RepID=A0ABP1G370_9CHLO